MTTVALEMTAREKTESVTFRCPSDLKAWLESQATDLCPNISALIVAILKRSRREPDLWGWLMSRSETKSREKKRRKRA